ncbi:MAG TPA: alkaline phosphatase family protein [Terriglobales bacterium]|nr:alkaline phosphatase family protein [Terriglobales bacterium]
MEDPIQHVIVLMLENHSFDQMLGCMKEVYPELEGVDISGPTLYTATDYPDTTHEIAQLHTNERTTDPDPVHEHVNVLRQLNPKYGYVSDYVQSYPHVPLERKAEVMGIYRRGFLPVLHTLAEHFAICDHWFSSLPGPTWPNRFFVHSGTSNGHVKMPSGVFDKNWHCYDQTTVYDHLSMKGISWKIYHHGLPQSLVMIHQLKHALHYHSMDTFFSDVTGAAKEFPQFSFIEPAYKGAEQNDQHPPSDVMAGERLLAQVYNALRANKDLWNSSLFLFVYDEHGGFYDHLTPPAAEPPDDKIFEYAFNQLGVRVPALLVSPWVQPGVIPTIFDHTSLLKYVSDKWGLGPLGNRTAKAASFGSDLTKLQAPRTNTPEHIDEGTMPAPIANPSKRVNEHQKALVSFSHFLEQELAKVEPLEDVARRALHVLEGPAAQFATAAERFERFFLHKKAGRL